MKNTDKGTPQSLESAHREQPGVEKKAEPSRRPQPYSQQDVQGKPPPDPDPDDPVSP